MEIGAPLLVALLGAALLRSQAVDRFENVTIDWRFRARGPTPPRSDIVVVEVDEASRRNLKQPDQRFDIRPHMPAAIRNLAGAGAKVVGLDVILGDLSDPRNDAELADVLAGGAVPVVLAVAHTDGRVKRSTAVFLDAGADEGVINVTPDPDGALRRLPGSLKLDVVNPDGTVTEIPHFPLVVAWYAVPQEQAKDTVVCDAAGAWIGPHRVHAGSLVDFTALRNQGWTRLSFEEVVRNQFDPRRVAGAVVLVGESRSISDAFAMPPGERTPGVYYHANVIAQILDGRRFRVPFAGVGRETGLISVLGFFTGLFAWNQRKWWEQRHGGTILGLYLVVGVTVFLGGWWYLAAALFRGRVVVPVAGPLAGMGIALGTGLGAQWLILNVNARRLAERARRIELLFGRSVSQSVLDALKADPNSVVRTQVRDVSVLFCDLRGFTAACTDLPPDQVAGMLNEYFDDITGPIFENDGFIDKFVGDEVMAVFSVPLAQPDHAERAVRAAVAIKCRLRELNRRREQRGQPPLDCGIGIHCGPAAAGHIGSSRRSNYTVVGNTVNLAARIEGLTEGGEILISRQVRDRLPSDVEATFWKAAPLRGSPGTHDLYVVDANAGV